MAGDTSNVWKDIELRIYSDPFCTSFQISLMNKNDRPKNLLKPNAPFKWVLWKLFQKHLQNVLQVKLLFLTIF